MWFDSHCHLNLAGFDASPEATWDVARTAGISRVFVPGTDPAEWASSKVSSLPGVATGIGLHPFTLEQWSNDDFGWRLDEALAGLVRGARHGHAAIGECGWDKPLARRCPNLSLELQTEIVERHLRLAVDLSLPIVMHVVQAHGLAIDILRRYALPRGGVIHCFSGNAELVPVYCRMGFALGYGTQLLRPQAAKATAALRATPRDHLLLETDAPFRSNRGELPNSPLALLDVASSVSRTLDVSMADLAELTTANARRVFDGQLASRVLA